MSFYNKKIGLICFIVAFRKNCTEKISFYFNVNLIGKVNDMYGFLQQKYTVTFKKKKLITC